MNNDAAVINANLGLYNEDSKDPTFSLQLLRAISETYYKGADIGECLSTAYRIKEDKFESRYKEWLNTAQSSQICR